MLLEYTTSTVPFILAVVQATDDLNNMAVVTVIMQSNQVMSTTNDTSVLTLQETVHMVIGEGFKGNPPFEIGWLAQTQPF